jgi:hypothetical protein
MFIHLIEFCSLKASRRLFLIGLPEIWNGKGGLVDSCVSCERCWILFMLLSRSLQGDATFACPF